MDFLIKKILVPEKQSFNIQAITVGQTTARVHSHENYELNFVKSGWGKRYVGDHISSFEKGDLVLLGPNLPHCWELSTSDSDMEGNNIVIHFQENFLGSRFIKTPELRPIHQLFKKAAKGIHFRGDKISEVQAQLTNLLTAEGLKALLRLLKIFDLLLEFEEYEYLSTPGYISQANQADFKRINKIYEYIFINFQSEISLEEVASLVNLTPGAFCRYFKKKTQKTLFEFLKEVRIGYACKLLSITNKTVSEIGYESGYNTLAHFNNQFKKVKNITPSKYRKLAVK